MRVLLSSCWLQVPDIIDNAYVIVEFDNGSRGMLDLCMFAEGSKNEQEISVVGDFGKVNVILSPSCLPPFIQVTCIMYIFTTMYIFSNEELHQSQLLIL